MRRAVEKLLRRAAGPIRPQVQEFLLKDLRGELSRAALEQSLVYKAGHFVASDKIQGDYLEFGVFRGGSFIKAYHALNYAFSQATTPGPWNTERDCAERRDIWANMRFCGFDSFEGLPELTSADASSRDFAKGKFAFSRSDFLTRIQSEGVPVTRVTTVA